MATNKEKANTYLGKTILLDSFESEDGTYSKTLYVEHSEHVIPNRIDPRLLFSIPKQKKYFCLTGVLTEQLIKDGIVSWTRSRRKHIPFNRNYDYKLL